MKRYKWFFLILVSGIFCSCPGTSEEQLVGDWQRRQPCPGAERCHATTFVIDNKGYLIGGYNGVATLRRDVFEFDHSAGDEGGWIQKKSLPVHIPARQQAVGFSVNGKGYMGTGWSFLGTENETTMRDFWQYNPEDDSWEEAAPLPEEAQTRRGAVAFSLKVGPDLKEYGFVGCGYTDEDEDRGYLLDFWRFDPEGKTTVTRINEDEEEVTVTLQGKWTPLHEVHDGYRGGKRAGALAFVIDKKAYICVGENPQNITEFWRFDPNAPPNNQWFKLRQMSNANQEEDYDDDYGSLGRAFGVAYVVDVPGFGLRGHIVGGRAGAGYTNWEYNHHPVLEGGDLWERRTSFYNNLTNQTREGMISFSFPSGRAFVGMGKSGTAYFDDLWEFKPLIEDDIYKDYQ